MSPKGNTMRGKTRSEACILVAALSAAVLLTSVSITFVEWTGGLLGRLVPNGS